MIIVPSNVSAATVEPVTSGQFLNLDAGLASSYSGSGTTWYDISGNGNNFGIAAASYTTFNGIPVMKFDGTVQSAYSTAALTPGANITVQAFTTINSASDCRTLIRAGITYHQIMLWNDGLIGQYNGSWASTGVNVSSIANYSTTLNCFTWKLASNTPYYQFSVNSGSWNTLTGGSQFYNTIHYIGGIENSQQPWGKIAAILIYSRLLSDTEIAQNYAAYKTRFALP